MISFLLNFVSYRDKNIDHWTLNLELKQISLSPIQAIPSSVLFGLLNIKCNLAQEDLASRKVTGVLFKL